MSGLDSTVSNTLRSLVLVEDGWSERGAIRRASKENPGAGERREVFRLVMDTLAKKSLLDRVIGTALGKIPTNKERLNLARLTAVLSLFSEQFDRGALDALRKNCPDPFRAQLERLVGCISADHSLDSYLKGTEEYERTGLVLGYPEWWVEYCIRVWGRQEALHLLSNNLRARYLHLNPLRPSQTAESEFSEMQGLEPVPSLPGFFRVLTEGLPGPVRQLVERGILEGQDLAAYLAVKAGAPTESDAVLDVCAAPGGKTGTLSQFMQNRGTIVSLDYSMGRMRDWKRMITTLAVENASGIVQDATRTGLRQEPLFDLILVDPPCSGSGIFEKNPAMKWHLSPQRTARYHELQYQMLQESSKLLKPDGRLVYSTCSISLEENEEVVSRFLSASPEFETRPTLEEWGHPGLRGYTNCRRFYPHLDNTAGYFIARMERFR